MKIILTLLISFVCVCVSAQSRTPTREEVRARFEQELDRVEVEGELETLRLRQSYIAALDVLIERMDETGDEEGIAVVMAEKERVSQGDLRPERVGGGLDLAMLMQAMQARVDALEVQQEERVRKLVQQFQQGARQVADRMQVHGRDEAAQSWREFAEEMAELARGRFSG